MSKTIKFDTLAYATKLKNAGMEIKLAEALAEAQGEVVGIILDDQLSMKQDIVAVKHDVIAAKNDMKQDIIAVKNDVNDLSHEMHGEITELRHNMLNMENRLMTKIGSIMIAGFGILAVLVHLH